MQKFPRRNVVEKPITIRHPLVLAQHVCFLAHSTCSRPNQAENSECNSRRRSVINRSTVGYQPVVGLSIRGGHAQPTVSSQNSTVCKVTSHKRAQNRRSRSLVRYRKDSS